MLYLTFTEPNADPQAMDLLKRQLSALVANRAQNPQAVFGDRLRALNTGNSYLVRPFTDRHGGRSEAGRDDARL